MERSPQRKVQTLREKFEGVSKSSSQPSLSTKPTHNLPVISRKKASLPNQITETKEQRNNNNQFVYATQLPAEEAMAELRRQWRALENFRPVPAESDPPKRWPMGDYSLRNCNIEDLPAILSAPSADRRNRNGLYMNEFVELCSGESSNSQESPGEPEEEDRNNNNLEDSSLVINDDDQSENGSSTTSSTLLSRCNVKRSNAFRQKDVIDTPETRLYKPKAALQRGRSLDYSGALNYDMPKPDAERVAPTRVGSTCHHRRQYNSKCQLQNRMIQIVPPFKFKSVPSNPCSKLDLDEPEWNNKSIAETVQQFNKLNMQTERSVPQPADHVDDLVSPNAQYVAKPRPLSYNEATSGSDTIPPALLPPEKPPRTFLYDLLAEPAPSAPVVPRRLPTPAELVIPRNKEPAPAYPKRYDREITPHRISTANIRSTHGPPGSGVPTPITKHSLNVKPVLPSVSVNRVNSCIPSLKLQISEAQPKQGPRNFKTNRDQVWLKPDVPEPMYKSSGPATPYVPWNQDKVDPWYMQDDGNHKQHSAILSVPNYYFSPVPVNQSIKDVDRNRSRQSETALCKDPKLVQNFSAYQHGGIPESPSSRRFLYKSKSDWALYLNQVGGRRNTVGGVVPDQNENRNTRAGHLPTPLPGNYDGVVLNRSRSGGVAIHGMANQLYPQNVDDRNGKDATSSTDSGIQLCSESLSSCDTPVGDSTTDTGDSDIENDLEASTNARLVIEARKGYIRRVSSIRIQELPQIQHLYQSNLREGLYECLLVVGLNRDQRTGCYHPYIRDKYPPNVKLPDGIEKFCFPDSLEWPCHEGVTAQFYTLAITDCKGARKFGCCFRILPEGADICIPITYCMISSNRAIGFYHDILKEIVTRHGWSEYQKRFLMDVLYQSPFTPPGRSLVVQDPVYDEIYQHPQMRSIDHNHAAQRYSRSNPMQALVIHRRPDQRMEESDLLTLFKTLDLSIIMKLFGSLLLERKVILLSRALNTLSLCVEALESMLYPFTWQHTFVPILPLNMTEVLEVPAPYLIGVLRSTHNALETNIDEGIVVDLDSNKVISCVGDEASILPKRIAKRLRDALSGIMSNSMGEQTETTKNVLISEMTIRMFVETIGHFGNHIIHGVGGSTFDKGAFIKQSTSKANQNFLEWFSETSMFHEFIETRMKGNARSGLFYQRVIEQLDSSNHGAQVYGHLNPKNGSLFSKGTTWLKETFTNTK